MLWTYEAQQSESTKNFDHWMTNIIFVESTDHAKSVELFFTTILMFIQMTLSVTKVLCDTLMPAAYCLYSYQQQQIGLSDCHITAYCGKITYILIIEHFQENYHGISCEANTFFSVYTYALKESVYQKNKFLSQATFWYTMTKRSIIIVKHAKEKT